MPRFQNVNRPYTAKQVAQIRGQILETYYSNYMAVKFYEMLKALKQK